VSLSGFISDMASVILADVAEAAAMQMPRDAQRATSTMRLYLRVLMLWLAVPNVLFKPLRRSVAPKRSGVQRTRI
jgi:hypothetical protein